MQGETSVMKPKNVDAFFSYLLEDKNVFGS